MGYSTDYTGELKFTSEPTVAVLRDLRKFFGEDCRDHKEWNPPQYASYIDLELTDEMDGIRWNGNEKTSPMDGLVNVVLTQMRKTHPDFGLSGQMLAQGESIEDRWICAIGEDGMAHHMAITIKGQKVECPHCKRHFMLETVGA